MLDLNDRDNPKACIGCGENQQFFENRGWTLTHLDKCPIYYSARSMEWDDFYDPKYRSAHIKLSTGIKNDKGKVPLTMVPLALKEEVAKVMAYGAIKYSRNNFKQGFPYSRLIDATMRHLEAFNDGIDLDHESGLSHLGHAAASIGMLLECIRLNTATDDRYKKSGE